MSETKIEWADTVWNPVTGCTKISPGCEHCYAERMAKRLAGRCGYDKDDPFKVTLHPDRLDEPFRWRKPRRVFVCSMGDLFHKDVPLWCIDEIISVIRQTPEHEYMILTKRPYRASGLHNWPQNAWLGVTAESQEQADKRIPKLFGSYTDHHFVSIEPMLGPVNITQYLSSLDWVIVGGESGPGARTMKPEWVREIRDACIEQHVPFFFKQWGGVHKKQAGRILDGRTWDEVPESMRKEPK